MGLNVVQNTAAFSVLLSGSTPLQSEGYGAGDGGRTRDVQLGKMLLS
jgi:hypothetical protein